MKFMLQQGGLGRVGKAGTVTGSTAYRFWRLYVTANDGAANYTTVGELELINGGGNQISTKNASSQSTANGGAETADQAADNSQDSEWATTSGSATPSWISYGFPSAISFTAFAIRSQRIVTGRNPTTFKLQGNNTNLTSGAPWVDVASVSGSTGWGIKERREYSI